MKLDVRYPFGACPPLSEYRRLVCYMSFNNLERQTFKCVACGSDTAWILVSQHKAVCSDECIAVIVQQHVLTAAPTPPAPAEAKPEAHHWLLDKLTPLQGTVPDPPAS